MRVRALLPMTVIGLLLAASAQAALADAPQGFAQSFPTRCGVESLASGREGNVWFACTIETHYDYGSRVKVGRATPMGKVTEFGGGRFPKNTEPGEIAVAPNGDLWVPLNWFYRLGRKKRRPPRIARVTPGGRIAIEKVPVGSKYYIAAFVAGPSGYLWFTTATGYEAKDPALWQIAPDGTIAKLPLALGGGYPSLAVGPEGDLWFVGKPASGAAKEVFVRLAPGGAPTELGADIPGFAPSLPVFAPSGGAWFFSGDKPLAAGRLSPDGEISETGATIEAGGGIVAGSTVGADGNLWFGFRSDSVGSSAIERVTTDGQVTAFSDCLRYGLPYFGPASLVTGADGNVYFTSLASRSLPSISDPPSIGRITPDGDIAQLYAGVEAEARWILPGPDGAIWFSAGGHEIQRIAPFSGPVNTFRVAPLRRASRTGAATARVNVPGPGTLSLKPLAFLSRHHRPVAVRGGAVTAASAACGTTELRVKPVGAAKRAFRRRGFAAERVAVTFTPSGGSPHTERATLYFHGGKPHGTRHPAGPPPPGKHRGEPLRVPQAGQNFPVRPPTLRFGYQPPGSYGDEEPSGRPLYPPFWITGLGHWREWHRAEERHGVPARARADGWIHYDTCDPDCVHGRYAIARAHVELDGESLCTKGPKRIFSTFARITVRVENGPRRTRFIQCTGRLRSGKRSTVIPPGVGFYR